MDGGWIKLHRSILDHWLMDRPDWFTAWAIMLMRVNWQANTAVIGSQLYALEPGEAVYSLASWAKLFGKNWSVQKVRTFFDALEKQHMINKHGDSKTTRITICNYASYQERQQAPNTQDNTDINTPATRVQQASNKQATSVQQQYKNSNNITEGEEGEEGQLVAPAPAAQAHPSPDYSILGGLVGMDAIRAAGAPPSVKDEEYEKVCNDFAIPGVDLAKLMIREKKVFPSELKPLLVARKKRLEAQAREQHALKAEAEIERQRESNRAEARSLLQMVRSHPLFADSGVLTHHAAEMLEASLQNRDRFPCGRDGKQFSALSYWLHQNPLPTQQEAIDAR